MKAIKGYRGHGRGAFWINRIRIGKYTILIIFLLIKVTISGAFKSENHHPKFKCTKCRPGYEVVNFCTETQDTVCQKCHGGTFSPRASRWHHCRDCKSCNVDEYLVTVCTATTNTVCSPCNLLAPTTDSDTLKDYHTKCPIRSRHGNNSKQKHLKRSNSGKERAPSADPGQKKTLDGPEYTVVEPAAPKTDAPKKEEISPPMAAAAAPAQSGDEFLSKDDESKDGVAPIIFIICGSALAVLLILVAVGIYVARRRKRFGKCHASLARKGSVDMEEQQHDEKPSFLPAKMPSAEPLRDDMEPLVVPEIAPNPVMSAPPMRGRTHVPNGTIQMSFANGPGVRPFGSEDFPFIDDDVEDDIFPSGYSTDPDPKTKSLDRDSSTKSVSPVHKPPFHSLPIGVSPSSMRSYEETKDSFDHEELSPCHSCSSHSSCYSLHSRHKDELETDEGETSPLLRAPTPQMDDLEEFVRPQTAQPEMAPLLCSSTADTDESAESEGVAADEGTYLYAEGEPKEALILDDEVEPRTFTDLERQFDQMAADWAAFNQDNPGMGTCIIFEDPSLETIPESPEFSYNSAENSVVSFGAHSNEGSNTSGNASITKRVGDSDSSSSGNLDCVAEFKTGPDRGFVRTPSPDLDEELDSVPQVGDRDSMFLEEDALSAQIPTNPHVPFESLDSNCTSDSLCATNMADIHQFLAGSEDDEIFIPQVEEPGTTGYRNDTVTSTDLERQLASIPAFHDSEDDEIGSDDAFHPNDCDDKDTGAQGFQEKLPPPITKEAMLHISLTESSSSSESSTDDSSSDDVGNNNSSVGLIFENRMVYR